MGSLLGFGVKPQQSPKKFMKTPFQSRMRSILRLKRGCPEKHHEPIEMKYTRKLLLICYKHQFFPNA